MNIERGLDPKDALDLGLKRTTRKWLKDNLKVYNNSIELVVIGEVCYVDCSGDLYFKNFDLNDVKTIPKEIQFRNVKGRYIFEKKPPHGFRQNWKRDSTSSIKDTELINKTRKWLKKYHITNSYFEQNTTHASKLYIDVDEDIVLWDIGIDDVADLLDHYALRHISGLVILGNGDSALFTRHKVKKELAKLAQEELTYNNMTDSIIDVKVGESGFVAFSNGPIVFFNYDFTFQGLPVNFESEYQPTILSRLSIKDIFERIRDHMLNLYRQQCEDKKDLHGLFNQPSIDDMKSRFEIEEPVDNEISNEYNWKVSKIADDSLFSCLKHHFPTRDRFGVELHLYGLFARILSDGNPKNQHV